MRNANRLMIALAVAVVGIPAAAYFILRPSHDPLGDRLRAFGFFPVDPPNTTMKVGGLYYVSADTRTFVPICEAEDADLDTAVRESPSVKIEEDLAEDGGLTAS